MAAVDWLRAEASFKLPTTLSLVVDDGSGLVVLGVFLFIFLAIIARNKRVPLLVVCWEGESIIGRVLNNIIMIGRWHKNKFGHSQYINDRSMNKKENGKVSPISSC